MKPPEGSTPRLTIGVLSHVGGRYRRGQIMKTWGKDAIEHADVDLVFLIGNPEITMPMREESILYLPCPDDYMSLPQKSRWFCLWALGYTNSAWLFKCDDDTYVRVDRLVKLTETLDYKHLMYGCRGGRGTKANLQGGAGYLLTRHGAMVLAAHMTKEEGAEDRQARYAIMKVGTRYRYCDKFYYRPTVYPTPENEQVTSHRLRPRHWRQIHAAFEEEK